MDRNEAYRLRDELLGGKRLLRDLPGDDFKGLIYWLLVDQFIAPTHQITLSDACAGTVEVVVIEHLARPRGVVNLSPGERTHFFECTPYGRNYELADLGNLFCAAIRHQPEVVALVSTRPLQAQAQDYIDLLFGRSGRFPRVDFQNLHAELLLGLPPPGEPLRGADPPPGHADPTQPARPATPPAEWRLVEHGTFHDRIVASSASADLPVRLFADRRYTVEIRGALIGRADAKGLRVTLSRDAGLPPVPSNGPPRVHGHDFLAQFSLAPETLAHAVEAGWAVHVDASGAARSTSALRLPAMQVTEAVESPFPDLRSDESAAIASGLHESDEVIAFVSGEAGVGKSYLCRQVASALKFHRGYQVENFRADSVVDGSLLVRVLLRLLTPRFHDGSEMQASDFNSRVVAEALRCLLHEFAPDESDSLSQAIAASDLARAHPDRLVPLIASLLVQSGRILLVLQDCHELPSTLISALDALIVALDERDWAGTRIIMEYRSGPGTDNPAWTSFVRRVRSTLHSRTRATHLGNLGQVQAEGVLRPLFVAINDELIAALWNQTGGNPLLLTSLLRSLLDTGALATTTGPAGGRLRVMHPGRILEGRPLRAEKPRLILENRIRLLDAAKPRALDGLGSVIPVLAILALTEGVLSAGEVFRYFDMAPADGDRLVRWLAREEILASSGESRTTVAFAHELIHDTVVELGRENEDTLSVAERIADEVQPEGYPALLRMAQLARYIGDLRLSRDYLNLGHEAAKNENRFHWSRRFQSQLLDLLRTSPNATLRDRLTQLELLNDLGWSEYNTGSNRVAREYHWEARRLAEGLPMGGDWTPQLMRATLAHVDHRIMGNDLALHEFQAFLGSAERALERVSDPTVLGRIINRLVLGCSALGFAEEGVYFARAGILLASASSDPEVNAVLCTDISTLLAPARADEALHLAEQGTGLAHSARQRMHSEYASMKHRLRARGHVDPPAHREAFHRRLRELGMVVLEGTLCNFEGIVELIHNGNTTDARRLFAQAAVHARLYDQVAVEPVIWNNAMVAALLHGDLDSAATHSASLHRFWTGLAEQRRLAAPRWASLISTFEAACSRIAPPSGPTVLGVPAPPPFAGGFLSSLVNLAALHQAGWRSGEDGLEPDVLLAHWTGSPHTRLSRSQAVVVEWNGVPLYLDP